MIAVDANGVVTVGQSAGEAAVVARYMGAVDVAQVTVPADDVLPDRQAGVREVNLGEILKALKRLELDDKTLCLWTSDNGGTTWVNISAGLPPSSLGVPSR